MKIIYFTTAMNTEDYNSFVKSWSFPLNPSNQNFHNKLIRSLSLNYDVEVISVRPYSRRGCSLKKLPYSVAKQGNITWHYVKISKNRFVRYFTSKTFAKKILKQIDLSNSIFLADTINPRVIRLATTLSKTYNKKIFGICTDSPSNISGTSQAYTKYLLEKSKNLDGYITLTLGLNDLFNKHNKPTCFIPGVIEENCSKIQPNNYGKYLFFGGALMDRYGIYDLIEGFKNVSIPELNLVICGHHANKEKLFKAINNDKNIYYLGCLSSEEVLTLEANAFANVNPRPYSEDLDRYSIPSKTLEYLASGRPTISHKNSFLIKQFDKCIIWSKTSGQTGLEEAITTVNNMSDEEISNISVEGKNKVLELCSINAVSKTLKNYFENNVK